MTILLGVVGLVVGVFATNAVGHATGKIQPFIAIVCMAVGTSIGMTMDKRKKST